MQLQVKKLLNRTHKLKGFVYGEVRLTESGHKAGVCITVPIEPRRGSNPLCSKCGKPGSCYDHQPRRNFEFVPLWGLLVFLQYRPRRVSCGSCGVHVERMPWSDGKSGLTVALMCFLATWAKRLSWWETARAFETTWDNVCRAVTWVVDYGLAHRDLAGIMAIGIDEIQYKAGWKYLTLVYQIDAGCKRLLWLGEARTKKTLRGFFSWLGRQRTALLQFVCSDMWKAYLSVVRQCAPQAVHVLDRFHIVSNLNKAVDEVRRQEAAEYRKQGDKIILKHARWPLLKRVENLTKRQRGRLKDLLKLNLKTIRAYLLKEDFDQLWTYGSPIFAGNFLDRWCERVMASRIEPMQTQARTLQQHRELILNYFRAKKELSSGVVEGLNNKVKVVTRRSYGFRGLNTIRTALFHTLGKLPEPPLTHRFA